ncbi:FG-GAP repeat domain-containing protein [Streptomyces sp. NPDC050418]|uniref:FG-GAP repeat domain-containing protein n=1 Tax=Streptomyces sp. NPDC050418 TaxID=3365612 RepID=UPI00378A762E
MIGTDREGDRAARAAGHGSAEREGLAIRMSMAEAVRGRARRQGLGALVCATALLAAGCTSSSDEGPDPVSPRAGAQVTAPSCTAPPDAPAQAAAPVGKKRAPDGDFNGDKIDDFAVEGWYRPVDGGTWRQNRAFVPGAKKRLDAADAVSLSEVFPKMQDKGGNPRLHGATVRVPRDLDGDGLGDLVFQDAKQRQYVVWGDRKGRHSATRLDAGVISLIDLPAGDVDGDGQTDLIGHPARLRDGGCHLYVLRGPLGRDGRPAAMTGLDLGQEGTLTVRTSLTGDFTGDGRTDLLVESLTGEDSMEGDYPAPSDRVDLYTGSDDGLVYAGRAKGIPDVLVAGLVADFDGDGADDLYLDPEDGPTKLYHGGPTAFLDGPRATGMAMASFPAASGDVNGDGLLDLLEVASGRNHPEGEVKVYEGSKEGLVPGRSVNRKTVGMKPGKPGFEVDSDQFGKTSALVDVNGDGFDDLLAGYVGYHKPREEQGYWVVPGTKDGLTGEGSYFLTTRELGTS